MPIVEYPVCHFRNHLFSYHFKDKVCKSPYHIHLFPLNHIIELSVMNIQILLIFIRSAFSQWIISRVFIALPWPYRLTGTHWGMNIDNYVNWLLCAVIWNWNHFLSESILNIDINESVNLRDYCKTGHDWMCIVRPRSATVTSLDG